MPGANASSTAHASGIEGLVITADDAKRMAKRLRSDLGETEATHSQALELVAHQLGFQDWNTAAARLSPRSPAAVGAAVPVLRVTKVSGAYPFYLDYLGFALEWEHRFAADMPVYASLRLDDCLVHRSEHYGDGTPGGVCWIPVRDVGALRERLLNGTNRSSRPGVDEDAPGGPTLEVTDPFGNVLRFCQRTGPG